MKLRGEVLAFTLGLAAALLLAQLLPLRPAPATVPSTTVAGEERLEKPFAGYLDVRVLDADGRLVHQHRQRISSATSNWPKFLAYAVFVPPGLIGSIATRGYVTDDAGAQKAIGGGTNNAAYSWDAVGSGWGSLWWIAFGNATSPTFSRDKYKLSSELARVAISAPSFSVTASNATISFSATYSPSTGVTITEVGLYLKFEIWDSTDDNAAYALMFYDVLSSPVTVPAGGSITVTYVFTFP